MTDLETILMCALIPVAYVVTYMAGKYDLLGQLAQMLQEKTASLTDKYAKVVRCKNCRWYGVDAKKGQFCKQHKSPSMWTDGITPLKPDDFCSYGERSAKK